MNKMPFTKYRPYPVVDLKDRAWPDKVIAKAPVWCSVDLRDGNQALDIPMNIEEKLALFELLVSVGFKEIEVGFPSAADVEFRFVRRLIEERRIPEDVTIQVLTQAREHLIRRSMEALAGVGKGIVHVYNSTSTVQREVVFGKSKDEIRAIAVEGVKLIRALRDAAGNPGIRVQYSPESFTGTELDYALEVCHAVMDAWGPTPQDRLIINLPATIEMSTPNVFADRVEWFSRNLRNRGAVTLCVHNHNDRGTAVAAAELAVLAGAERVEGALFGNGERSGNMDVITMALNLFSRGVDPELDFSDVNRVRDVYTRCTRMEVHPRHPYAGDLIFTAFSGSHQDAINKGMKVYERSDGSAWDVPYIPIDPKDVGRTYESIIRINSQSGKGGAAYVMEKGYGIQVPKWMQADFGRIVQALTDRTGAELEAQEVYECFLDAYVRAREPYRLEKCHIDMDDDEVSPAGTKRARVRAVVHAAGREIEFEESGNGPVDAFVRGLGARAGAPFTVEQYAEHALAQGADAQAVAYIAVRDAGGKTHCGAGIDANISVASLKAVVSALNRSRQ